MAYTNIPRSIFAGFNYLTKKLKELMNIKIATVICSIVLVAFLILLFFIPLTSLDDWMTHSTAPRVPFFCSYQILTSSVIYY